MSTLLSEYQLKCVDLVLQAVMARLATSIEAMASNKPSTKRYKEAGVQALQLSEWGCQLATLASVRPLCCAVMGMPLEDWKQGNDSPASTSDTAMEAASDALEPSRNSELEEGADAAECSSIDSPASTSVTAMEEGADADKCSSIDSPASTSDTAMEEGADADERSSIDSPASTSDTAMAEGADADECSIVECSGLKAVALELVRGLPHLDLKGSTEKAVALELVRGLPPLDLQGSTEKDCLIRRFLNSLASIDEGALHACTTLLLLLLYDADFKYECTAQLLDFYGGLMSHIVAIGNPHHPLTSSFDRLTVQLFNFEEVTVKLIKNKKLLEALLGCTAVHLIMQLAETLPASVTADQEAENLQGVAHGYRKADAPTY
eukprot:gene13274-19116_t